MTQLAEMIAQRVADKLIALQKKALVVYTGSLINFKESLESLRKLREEGFTYQVFLSQSAGSLLDVNAIREALQPENLWIGTTEQPPEALATGFHTVLVPALTINSAAHIAACMPCTPATRMITSALWKGKNVIFNIDGCCPDNAFRVANYRMTEPLKAQLRQNLVALQAHGGVLTSASGLYAKALKVIGSPVTAATPAPKAAASCVTKAAPSASKADGSKVISRGNVMNVPAGGTLRVSKAALITPLARDAANVRGVTIIQE